MVPILSYLSLTDCYKWIILVKIKSENFSLNLNRTSSITVVMVMAQWVSLFFSFVINISGAKVKEHSLNTSKDILD